MYDSRTKNYMKYCAKAGIRLSAYYKAELAEPMRAPLLDSQKDKTIKFTDMRQPILHLWTTAGPLSLHRDPERANLPNDYDNHFGYVGTGLNMDSAERFEFCGGYIQAA